MSARNGSFWSDVQEAGEGRAGVMLLVFRMDGREHALPIEHVVEVLLMVAITPGPDGPPWVSGVINFRGRVIVLVDVRVRLGAPRRAPDVSTPIIVVQTGKTVAGLVVDEVVEVLALRSEAVDAPDRAIPVSPAVCGVAREGDRLILVLDRERLCAGSIGLRLPFDAEDTSEAGH
jgi:purine-binding chemotaxis protein CheW